MSVGTKGGAGGGGAGGANAIRLGGAFFEVFGKDNLSRVLDGLKKKALAFGHFMQGIGKASLGASLALAAPLTAVFATGVDYAADIKDISEIYGISAEKASQFAYAFEVAGGGFEDFQQALAKAAKANTSGKPMDEFILDIAKALEEIDDPAERFQKASEVFGGKFAAKFLDAAGGVEELQRLMARATPVTGAQAAAAEKVQMAWREAGLALKTSLIPALEIVVPYAKMFAEFMRRNAGAVTSFVVVAAGLAAFGATSLIVGSAVTGLIGLLGLLKGALLLALTPVGIGVLAFAGLTAWFVTSTEAGKAFASWVKGGLVDSFNTLATAWGGVVEALKKGDLELAGEIAVKGLEIVWLDLVRTLTLAWAGFKMTFVDTFEMMVAGAKIVWNEFVGWFTKKVFAVIDLALAGAAMAAKAVGASDLANTIEGAKAALPSGDTIDAMTLAKNKEITDELIADLKERKEARLKDIEDASAAVDAAKAELAALVGKAGAVPLDFGGGGDFGSAAAAMQLAEGVKGGFSGAALSQQFAVGDQQSKQTEFLRQINAGEGKLPDAIGAAVAENMLFG